MTKIEKVELLVPAQQRHPGRPARVTKVRKVAVDVVVPDSLGQMMEDLLVFDAKMLDRKARQELLRLIPGLLHASRFWTARFAEKGCLCCHRKKVPYASGGLCDRCHSRERHGMWEWYSKRYADRDTEKETSALARRFDAAQALFR